MGNLKIWLGEEEPTLEGYEWVKDATILAVHRDVDAIAICDKCGDMNGCDFIALMNDVGAYVGTLFIYEIDEGKRAGMTAAAIEFNVAENVLVSDDGGYSFSSVK